MVASCVSHSLHSLLQHLSHVISLAFVLPMLSSLNSLLISHLYTISHLQSSNRGKEAGSTETFKKGRKQGVEDGRPIPVPHRPVPVPCRPGGSFCCRPVRPAAVAPLESPAVWLESLVAPEDPAVTPLESAVAPWLESPVAQFQSPINLPVPSVPSYYPDVNWLLVIAKKSGTDHGKSTEDMCANAMLAPRASQSACIRGGVRLQPRIYSVRNCSSSEGIHDCPRRHYDYTASCLYKPVTTQRPKQDHATLTL